MNQMMSRVTVCLAAVLTLVSVRADAGFTNDRSQANLLWPNGRVPYVLDPQHAHPDYVYAAMNEFHGKTSVRFVVRTTEPDYLYITNAPQDSFQCGWQGSTYGWGRLSGKQIVSLSPSCIASNYVHEFAHILGLWHENQRHDQGQNIVVRYENILTGYGIYFQAPGVGSYQPPTAGTTKMVGAYDFASIMHYHPWSFSKNGQATITRLDGSLYDSGYQGVWQLSPGDVGAIEYLYPTPGEESSPEPTPAPAPTPTPAPEPTPTPTNLPPIATFTVSVTSGLAPVSVAFNASGSSDPESGLLEYLWNYGDGQYGSGVKNNHIFTSQGKFNVALTVKDQAGAMATSTATIVVEPASPLQPPANLQGIAGSVNVSLKWTDTSTGESGYVVERANDKGTRRFDRIAILPSDAQTFVDSDVDRRTNYLYRVSPLNGNGAAAAYSNTVSIRTR
jgi:PKD repeat protein